MSPRSVFIVAVVTSVIVLLLPIGLYIYVFGWVPSEQPVKWDEFGGYFGGVLAPIFAMLAFLAVLYTIHVQADYIKAESRKADLTRVVNSIDQEIERILVERVSEPDTQPELNFYHMAHEAERQQDASDKTGAYKKFLEVAATQGTVVGASYRRLVARLADLATFIDEYDPGSSDASMLRKFYSGKFSFLRQMIQDEKAAPSKVTEFLAEGQP